MRLIREHGETWLRCCNLSCHALEASGVRRATAHLHHKHGFPVASASQQIPGVLKRHRKKKGSRYAKSPSRRCTTVPETGSTATWKVKCSPNRWNYCLLQAFAVSFTEPEKESLYHAT